MNSTESGNLENEVRELRLRVQRLEEGLHRQGILSADWNAQQPVVAPAPVVPAQHVVGPPPPASSVPTPAPLLRPIIPPPSFSSGQSPQQSGRSLETRIGSQWFNRIGILAVLIGMAWFLKFAIDNHWIGPLGRVLIGLIAGAGLIIWSERFRSNGYAVFSYSLKSVGSGILYLSLWAAFSLYHLIPAPVAFFAMIAVTAFNGYLSWRQDSELLALYAIAGGFGTPILVSTGENHEATLFGYMLLLNLTVLVLVALKPWSRLLFGAFTGTLIYAFGWYSTFYTADQFAQTAFFFACFFMVFALAPRLVRIDPSASDPGLGTSLWDKLATVVLPLLNASLGFLAFYNLLGSIQADWAQPWLAVLFATFYLLLLRLPAQGRWQQSPQLLAELHLSAAVVFLTIAIPLKASGRWLTVGWMVEGAALLFVAARMRSTLLRGLALGCLVLAFVALLTGNSNASFTPIFNERFATYVFGIATFAFSAWIAMKAGADNSTATSNPWPTIAAICALTVNLLILIAVGLEIHAYWWNHNGYADYRLFSLHRMYAQFSYSAFFMMFGAILLALGFSRESAFLRWQGLVLLAFSIGKVFLVDVSELSQGYRILSFLGLGALLLGVSFVYQRDVFSLRKHGGPTA